MIASRLPQPEDRQQGIVDAPELLTTQMPSEIAEPPHVDRTDLLHQHTRRLISDLDLRSERCGSGTTRGRCNEHDRSREHLVSLHDHAEAISVLLVANATWELEAVNVTAEHAATPSSWRRPASRHDLLRPPPEPPLPLPAPSAGADDARTRRALTEWPPTVRVLRLRGTAALARPHRRVERRSPASSRDGITNRDTRHVTTNGPETPADRAGGLRRGQRADLTP